MRGEQHPKHAALRSLRARTIEQLTNAFTRDELGLDEFEQRLNQAYAASAPPELDALVGDLSSESAVFETELVAAPRTALATVERPARGQRAVAILGSVERRGHWAVARASSALAVLGSVVIDLRDVALPAGVTTLEVSAVLGSIEILVPPNLAVESEGSGILGSFEGVHRVPPEPDPDLPILRVQGRAVLGSIEVVTRPDDARMARGALHGKSAPRLGPRRS
ncbi:MAG TPA: LiaF domain-containing protein [Polyangiaceae bacterium]|jgi:hypothetical protein|nr:LiaF domain-containing protein [Polyangiaceae bacterium]